MNQIIGIKEDGSQFMMLVLEPANMHRLTIGGAIKVQIEALFPDGIPAQLDLMITYSETPQADAKEFLKMSERVSDTRTPKIEAQRPHCPECRSTIEQIGKYGQAGFPMTIFFCPVCGCVLGVHYEAAPKPALFIGETGLPQREM